MTRGLAAGAAALVLAGAGLLWHGVRIRGDDVAVRTPAVVQTARADLLRIERGADVRNRAQQPPRVRAAIASGAAIEKVRVNAPALRILEVGDQFALPLPSAAEALRGVITRRVQHANGDVSLTGSIDGQTAPAVMTIGARETYITAGGFEVTAINGVGSIVPAAQLGPPDPTVPDYLVVKRQTPKPIVPRILP